MSFSFGVQKDPIYGTYGEFTIGAEENQVRAQFLLTKMKPGTEGSWENALADQMVPWREVFNIEEMTFDELLQRDLDDSRVVHELIPYLLGESGAFARFFPPILAVIAPKKAEKTGIMPYYPVPRTPTAELVSFGDVFDFEKTVIDGQVSPLGIIKYNRSKTSFIIVDGQHRAMAVLALHRQINKTWKENKYAGFYNHLALRESAIKNIELPVCVVFFPDIHAGNEVCQQKGINLQAVCREIFVVVNKKAKQVSESRELLLDDEDLAARMMRETLSLLKDRGEEDASVAHVYSFDYGDAVSTEVVAGQLEYTSAVALHKMHAAVAFGMQEAFQLDQNKNVADGGKTLNSKRPAEILIGTKLDKWSSLSRRSGRYHHPDEVEEAVKLLAKILDVVMLPLFDSFRPFAVHNSEMRALRTRLKDADLIADPIERKCFRLLFEGSGVRKVFEEHKQRLSDRKKQHKEEGRDIGDYVRNQLKDAKMASARLKRYEEDIKGRRAARLFAIDYDKFSSTQEETKELLDCASLIYETISTQAFQLGYLMAVHSVVELLLTAGTEYDRRLKVIEFVSSMYLAALNRYFSAGADVQHRTLKGFVKEKRARVFDPNQPSLRGLLAKTVKNLDASQWAFFRYAILEIVHSKHAYKALLDKLNTASDPTIARAYRRDLPKLTDLIDSLRYRYIKSSVDTAIKSSEFKQEILLLKVMLQREGKSENEIAQSIAKKEDSKVEEVKEQCKQNISASLGEFADADRIANRLL
ncbi:MAG: DNA sulfur modification protein DndB [Hormoscilla sp.]